MLSVDDIPVLPAERVNGVQLKVYCEHCGGYHYHGLGDGHRIAHCMDRTSDYYRTGYFIHEIKKR